LRYVGHWSVLGFGYWLVEEKISGQFVGEVGFADYKREIEPSIDNVPEIGWVLVPAMHGNGYATESVRAAINWFADRFATIRTVCLIAPENAASIRVAIKCEYKEYLRTTYKGKPTSLFVRDAIRQRKGSP
jgi:RimJ/RimL family protein N-acetyltransferase